MNTSKQKSWTKAALIFGLVCLALMLALWLWPKEDKPVLGPEKEMTVLVVHGDGTEVEKTFTTKTESLGAALEEQEIAQGEQGPYGLFIKTADGESIDASKEQWWCITKGGEPVMTGADLTAIAHGDRFELTFTQGY